MVCTAEASIFIISFNASSCSPTLLNHFINCDFKISGGKDSRKSPELEVLVHQVTQPRLFEK
jgi:hypothetical protein